MSNVYVDNGYASRQEYLHSLAEDYGVPTSIVYALATTLGENEDFDGLVTSLEDYADYFGDE